MSRATSPRVEISQRASAIFGNPNKVRHRDSGGGYAGVGGEIGSLSLEVPGLILPKLLTELKSDTHGLKTSGRKTIGETLILTKNKPKTLSLRIFSF